MANNPEDQTADHAHLKATYAPFKNDMAMAEEAQSGLEKMTGNVHRLEDILASQELTSRASDLASGAGFKNLMPDFSGITGMISIADAMVPVWQQNMTAGLAAFAKSTSISETLAQTYRQNLTTGISALTDVIKANNENILARLMMPASITDSLIEQLAAPTKSIANMMQTVLPTFNDSFKDIWAGNPGFASVFTTLNDAGWLKQTGVVSELGEQIAGMKTDTPGETSFFPDFLSDQFVDSVLEHEEELLNDTADRYEDSAQEIAEQNPALAEAVEEIAKRRNLTPTQQVCLYLSVGAFFAFFTYIGILMLEDSKEIVEGLMEAGEASAYGIATSVGGGAGLIAKTMSDPYVEKPGKDEPEA